MDSATKAAIGQRLRGKREQANYTREQLGELCSLSPRFIANIELGDSAFSLDSLMSVCRVLSCSADYLLFGITADSSSVWAETVSRLEHLDAVFQPSVDKILQGLLEAIAKDLPADRHQSIDNKH